MVVFKNIFLAFDEKEILRNFSFKVKEGENICISGESGKGKSSLLKLIQGYLIANKGEIFVFNKKIDPENIKYIRKNISWLPQNINLPVDCGLDLIKLLGLDESQKKPIITLMKKLGLEKEIYLKDFSEISGGEKQRIILSICLNLNRKLLLLDEPTSSLDEKAILFLKETIVDLRGKNPKLTIISSSHNKSWLDSCDRVIEL